MVEQLAKENPRMPKGAIMDLVRMYKQMTPEQRERFDEEMENWKEERMERTVENEVDNTEVLHFESAREQDEFLRKEGKLGEPENEDITYDLTYEYMG